MKLKYNIILFSVIVLIQACKKEEVFENPYAGGKASLSVKMSTVTAPSPTTAAEGEIVTFSATGLLPYKNDLSFFFNGQKGEVTSVTDAEIKVKVPVNASSGVTSLAIGDQVFFGPVFQINGKITFDPEFTASGANSSISGFYKIPNDERMVLVGSFNDFNGQGFITPALRITRIFKDGRIDPSFKSGGASGALNEIVKIGTKYFVAGSFSSFYHFGGRLTAINYIDNITRLNDDGSLDSVRVNTSLTKPPLNKTKAIPAFNGGTSGTVNKIFVSGSNIVAIGSFKYYLTHRYDVPKKPVISGDITINADSVVTDSIVAPQVIRLSQTGSLDKTYRFNTTLNRGFEAGNGYIYDGFMHADGKILLVGTFRKFDNTVVNGVVRLDVNGSIDPTFKTGTGADSYVYSVTFNEATNKYLLAGNFGQFNGKGANGIVLLNLDGSIDNTFNAKVFNEGSPTFAKQLSNGMIVVSGTFVSYDNVRRGGFMILNANGELASRFNNTGPLSDSFSQGVVSNVYESTDSSGKLTVTLMGSFTKFDGKKVGNITRLTFEL